MRNMILTITAIIIAGVSAFSQSVTEIRQIKTTALQVYENYKVVTSGLYSKSAYTEDNFMAIFDNTALIYNDILPDNNPQQLSPSRYFRKFTASVKRVYPIFSDFKMGEPVSVGNKWQIKCNFTRGARFLTQKDMKYPEWSFNYTMTIEMDKLYNKIKKVYENARTISVDVDNPLKGFFIIENQDNVPLVTKSDEILKDWDEEYHSHIFPEDKWKINDIRVSESIDKSNFFASSKGKFTKNQTDANFYKLDVLQLKKNIFGIGINYSPLTFGNKMSQANASDTLKGIQQTSKALSLSFFYGKQIAHKEKSIWFFNVGLDFSRYSYNYSSNSSHIEFQAFDIEKDSCTRKIQITSLEENINIISVSVPLSIQYLHQLSQQTEHPTFLSFEFGIFAETALSSSSNYSINADYSALYPQYFDVTFDHYLGYGNINKSKEPESINPRFNGGVFGGIGLWYALNSNSLLKFSISYKHGFNSPLKYTANSEIFINKDSYQSLLHSTDQGLRNISIGISWVKTIGGK